MLTTNSRVKSATATRPPASDVNAGALDIGTLRVALQAVAEPADAPAMARYMKDRFAFLGIKTPARRAASEDVFAAARWASADELVGFAHRCWAEPEPAREPSPAWAETTPSSPS